MAAKTRYWFFQSSRDSLIRFTRVGNHSVFVKNIEGDIGVIGISQTFWYTGHNLTRSEENQGGILLPLLVLTAQSEQMISNALKRHSRDLEVFCHRFGPHPDGTLHVVLMDSERQEQTLSMTMAFGFALGELVPDFEGVELDTIFANEIPRPTPPPRISRYERKWVI